MFFLVVRVFLLGWLKKHANKMKRTREENEDEEHQRKKQKLNDSPTKDAKAASANDANKDAALPDFLICKSCNSALKEPKYV